MTTTPPTLYDVAREAGVSLATAQLGYTPNLSAQAVARNMAAAIAASPCATEVLPTLSSQNGFALIFRTTTAKRVETRAKRIAEFVAMLERGETPYPQAPKS